VRKTWKAAVVSNTQKIYWFSQQFCGVLSYEKKLSLSLAACGNRSCRMPLPILRSRPPIGRNFFRRVYDGTMSPGRAALRWDGKNQHGVVAGSGVYLLRVEFVGRAGKRESAMQRVVLMK